MKLIIGLGNPGAKYRGTRHNIGFAVIDEVARRAGGEFETAPVDALIAKIRFAGPPRSSLPWSTSIPSGSSEVSGTAVIPVMLAKPLTFMNESGRAIGELTRYFKIEIADMLVMVDEVQLPLAKLRARPRGSAGGHNGLKSIIEYLGSDFSRLRVGVGRGDSRRGLADHVLAKFEADEMAEVERMTRAAADAAEMFITSGIEAVMNGFNGGDSATTE